MNRTLLDQFGAYKAIPKTEIQTSKNFLEKSRIIYSANTALLSLGVIPKAFMDQVEQPFEHSLLSYKPLMGSEKY